MADNFELWLTLFIADVAYDLYGDVFGGFSFALSARQGRLL